MQEVGVADWGVLTYQIWPLTPKLKWKKEKVMVKDRSLTFSVAILGSRDMTVLSPVLGPLTRASGLSRGRNKSGGGEKSE
jgi:hypothetical protein